MPVPLPESDTILMREHLFRNSKDVNVVLQEDPVSFKAIEYVGLGSFNYKLVDMDTIYDENIKGSIIIQAFNQTIEFIRKSIIDILLVIILIAIFFLLISCAYPFHKKNDKDSDLENQIGIPDDFKTTNNWEETNNSFQSFIPSEKENFRPRSPATSNKGFNSIKEKELLDVLRID